MAPKKTRTALQENSSRSVGFLFLSVNQEGTQSDHLEDLRPNVILSQKTSQRDLFVQGQANKGVGDFGEKNDCTDRLHEAKVGGGGDENTDGRRSFHPRAC